MLTIANLIKKLSLVELGTGRHWRWWNWGCLWSWHRQRWNSQQGGQKVKFSYWWFCEFEVFQDNCVYIFNPDQADTDELEPDKVGDACGNFNISSTFSFKFFMPRFRQLRSHLQRRSDRHRQRWFGRCLRSSNRFGILIFYNFFNFFLF